MCMHADTHSLYQSQGFCQHMCQHYQSYFSHWQSSRSQIPAKVLVCRRAFVSKVPVTCTTALACTHFFYFRCKPLCVSVRTIASVGSSLCALLHKRTQKPQTMQRALAKETDFCPTPTNRKLLLHPPHPAFVSHADAHRQTHTDGKCNHAVQEH